jgi:hypothetical protein
MKTPAYRLALRGGFCGLLAATMAFSGCETPGQTALLGAATGAAVGGAATHRGSGALAGAAIGAGAGYLAGAAVRDQRERAYDQGYRDARYDSRRGYYDRRGYWHYYD